MHSKTWSLARSRRFDFVVGLNSTNNGHHCLGAIISSQHVLTTGHCVHSVGLNPNLTFYGPSDDQAKQMQKIKVKKIHMHPNWTGDMNDYATGHDLALVQLDRRVSITFPVSAGQGFHIHGSMKVYILRLGAETLEVAKLTVVLNNRCPNLGGFSSGVFCTYSMDIPMQGDYSGAPVLFIDDQPAPPGYDLLDINIGVAAFSNCTSTRHCGVVVVDVSKQRDWVDGIVNDTDDHQVSAVVITLATLVGILAGCTILVVCNRLARPFTFRIGGLA